MDEPSDNMFPNVYSKTNGTGSPSINSMKNVNERNWIRSEKIDEKKKEKEKARRQLYFTPEKKQSSFFFYMMYTSLFIHQNGIRDEKASATKKHQIPQRFMF
eukprot:scaffold1905_cov48-Attheya_sp.AAC.2